MAKITTGELYNEWQSINDKLDKLNEKVDSVIDDGAIDTRLTGSNVECFKETSYEVSGTTNIYLASGSGSGPLIGDDLDVSDYKQVAIFVSNQSNKLVRIQNFYFRTMNKDRTSEYIHHLAETIDVPEGADTWLITEQHKFLNVLNNIKFPYVRLRLISPDRADEGKVSAVFVGVKS